VNWMSLALRVSNRVDLIELKDVSKKKKKKKRQAKRNEKIEKKHIENPDTK